MNTLIKYTQEPSDEDLHNQPTDVTLMCTDPLITYNKSSQHLIVVGEDVSLQLYRVISFSLGHIA